MVTEFSNNPITSVSKFFIFFSWVPLDCGDLELKGSNFLDLNIKAGGV